MTRIILVRHGHVEGIDPERFRGREDIPLSPLGLRQAIATGRRIAAKWSFSEVYTSPLQRCLETSSAIGELSGRRIIPLDELNDLDYGRWRWKTFDEVRSGAPDMFDMWFTAPDLVSFPGGETLEDLQARTAIVLHKLEELAPGQTVVVVGHDSVNRVLLLQLLGMPLSKYWRIAQSPCGISEIEMEDRNVRIIRMNETCHLDGVSP